MIQKLKAAWVYIAAFLGVLLAFFYERNSKENSQAKLLLSDEKNKDAQLKQQQVDIEGQIKDIQEQTKQQEATAPSKNDILDTLNKL